MLDLTPPNLLNQTSLPFRDARGCKEWLGTLPLSDARRAHAALVEVVDSLNLTELPGFERLKIMELMRDRVAYVQESVTDIFAGKPLPLSRGGHEAWDGAETLWEGMEQGYRYCLRTAANDDAETAKHFALIIERCLRYTGLQMLHHGRIHRETPARLFQDLHDLFQFAEKRGVAHVTVKDSIDGHRGVTTATQAYVRALLIDAARTSMLMPTEQTAVDELLKKWAAKVVISRIPPERATALLRCTDLSGTRGLWMPSSKPTEEGALIFLDLKDLSESLGRRIRKLATSASLGDLGLPAIFAQVPVSNLLNHIYHCWCEAEPRQGILQAVREECDVASGFEAFYHCLAGKPFEAPRQSEELSALEMQQLAVFGKVVGKVSSEPEVEVPTPTESWKLEGAGGGRLLLRRPGNSKISLGLQELLCYRKSSGINNYGFGLVCGVTDLEAAGILAEVLLLSDRAEPVIFRSKDAPFAPAIRMHPVDPSARPSLVLPSGAYQHGKVVEVRGEVIHMYRLTGLTQHGPNFDWASCELL